MDRMPNHTVLRELSTAVHAANRPSSGHPGSRFQQSAQGCLVPRYRRADVLSDSREAWIPSAGSCFFRAERQESPYKSARRLEKKKEEEEKMDERRRASGRTSERRQRWKLLERKKKRKKKKHATVGVRVYSLLRTIRTLRGSASVILVPPGHGWSRNGRIKER